jgi:hypothetical protein
MTAPGVFAWALQALTIALAWMLARRRPQHRPFAWFASVMLAVDVVHVALNLGPLDAPRPYAGFRRVLFHVDQALFLSWPVGLAAVAWIVFLERRLWWPPVLAGVVALVVFVVGYPSPFRGATLMAAYALTHAAAVVACLVAMALWTRRRAPPRPEHACTSLTVLLDCALFAGPYAPPAPAPLEMWNLAQLLSVGIWACLALIHAGALWNGFMMVPLDQDASKRSR